MSFLGRERALAESDSKNSSSQDKTCDVSPLGSQERAILRYFPAQARPMSKQATDTELMLRYQKGEVRAFEYLLDRYQGPIFNFILRSVRSRALAEELTQETFVRVIKNAQKYKKKAKFTTWLYTIARNICIDQSRRAKHRKTESLDKKLGQGESNQTLLDKMSDDQPSPAHASSNKELQSSLLAALDTLRSARGVCVASDSTAQF